MHKCSETKCEQCIVRKLSSLKALSKEELLKVAEHKSSYIVKKGDSIFHEGESTNGVYCVKSGVCKLSKLSSNGKDQIVKLIAPGELLGQRSMISDEVANLSAIALEEMEVCFIPKSQLMSFFNSNQDFSMQVLKSICADLKEAEDHTVNMAQKTVKERLAETLLYIENTFGIDENNALKLQLSREELANMIGTATESCIRLLSEFNKNGYIELIGKKIALKNRAILKQLSN